MHELDKEITIAEIDHAISNLKRDKANGPDCIINEYFIEFKVYLMTFFHRIFNCILATGFFPQSWSSAVIIPIFKKGDSSLPGNYRGISLISCFGKLLTRIFNQRLLDWSAHNDIIPDSQFGFRPHLSTVDAIFSLHSIISHSLNGNKRMYCAFVDFNI